MHIIHHIGGFIMMKILICIISFSILFLFSTPVYAYLDAGSGSMILQLLLGGLAGLAVILKFYWRKILGIFGITRDENEDFGSSNKT